MGFGNNDTKLADSSNLSLDKIDSNDAVEYKVASVEICTLPPTSEVIIVIFSAQDKLFFF